MASIIDKAKEVLGQHNGKTYTLAGSPVGSTGFGMMGLTWRPNPVSQEQAFAAMKAALDNGANFFNGGELYGTQSSTPMLRTRASFRRPFRIPWVLFTRNLKEVTLEPALSANRKRPSRCFATTLLS